MLYNEKNRRTNRDAVRREQTAIRGQRKPANSIQTPPAVRRIQRDDPNHINNRTRQSAPAPVAAPSLTATRNAFDRTRADLGARRESERVNVLRALGA